MDYSGFCYVLYVFCLSLKIDKQVVKTVVLQVSSAIFSKYFYDSFFFSMLFSSTYLFCSICFIYKGEGRNEKRPHMANSGLLRKMYHRKEH